MQGRRWDPRYFQIGALSCLLLYGMVRLDFGVPPLRALFIVSVALGTQLLCTRLWKLPQFDPKSAMISALSLCLLLRTNSGLILLLTTVITIASKFVLRWKGKHLFNPTNFGIVLMMFLTDQVWISPGQWGSTAFFGFLLLCIGGLVVNRAARSDVTYAFIIFYAGLLIARSVWLNEPLAIPLHRLESGALLIFTFFMISDPRTTPDSRTGRILFAAMVALGAAYIQFKLFRSYGPLWALAFLSPAVPLIDYLLPGKRYQWGAAGRKVEQGDPHEENVPGRVTVQPAV